VTTRMMLAGTKKWRRSDSMVNASTLRSFFLTFEQEVKAKNRLQSSVTLSSGTFDQERGQIYGRLAKHFIPLLSLILSHHFSKASSNPFFHNIAWEEEVFCLPREGALAKNAAEKHFLLHSGRSGRRRREVG